MNCLIINCSPVRTGATAEIVRIAAGELSTVMDTKCICIDDYSYSFCKGCRACHLTGKCVQSDGVQALMDEFEWADVILAVSPSYWADVPGQFKAFIDRCTPWSNTHDPHSSLSSGKKGYTIALRTGPGMKECEGLFRTVEHFFGHLEIAACGHLGLCSVENKNDVLPRKDEIIAFCRDISA